MRDIDNIYNKQTEVMKRFDKVEHNNGMLQVPLNWIALEINDKFVQARIKDFAWRVTEEITETTDAFVSGDNWKEELADVYAFLIELFIIAGLDKDTSLSGYSTLEELYIHTNTEHAEVMGIPPMVNMFYKSMLLVESIGRAMNCLKMRSWKADHNKPERLTDKEAFYEILQIAHMNYLDLCISLGVSYQEVVSNYLDKTEINNQRISSGE